MSITTQLFTGVLKINNKSFSGPVATTDYETFVWVNRSSGEDYYFYLKKGVQGWFQVEGIQEISYPQSAINAIGAQIDEWLTSHN